MQNAAPGAEPGAPARGTRTYLEIISFLNEQMTCSASPGITRRQKRQRSATPCSSRRPRCVPSGSRREHLGHKAARGQRSSSHESSCSLSLCYHEPAGNHHHTNPQPSSPTSAGLGSAPAVQLNPPGFRRSSHARVKPGAFDRGITPLSCHSGPCRQRFWESLEVSGGVRLHRQQKH